MVDLGVCWTAFSMLCICATIFAILRFVLSSFCHSQICATIFAILRNTSPHSHPSLILMPISQRQNFVKIRKFFSSILPIKRNLLTHLDGLLVTSLTVGVFGQVSIPLCLCLCLFFVFVFVFVIVFSFVFVTSLTVRFFGQEFILLCFLCHSTIF